MNFLFKKTDPAFLFFFRIVFGVLATVEAISSFTYLHLYKKAFQPENFQFKYYGFEWASPLPEPFMSIYFVIHIFLALAVLVGWRYRLTAFLYGLCFSYSFFLDASYYLNHGYLFMVLCFVMACLPAHRIYSLDVWQGRVSPLRTIASWPLLLLRFMMATVYIYGGIAKINPDWLQAMPLKIWLDNQTNNLLLGSFIDQDWVAWLMAYGGLFLDLFVVFFLLFRKTRPWAFAFVIFFHFFNLLIFEIGIFPWMSTAFTALFFPPDFPRRVWYWFTAKFSKLNSITSWWEKTWAPSMEQQVDFSYSGFQQKTIVAVLFLFCSVQLLLPFRHHLYTGNVVWTEQGHRFAWRMMLRSKQGRGDFTVVDSETKKEIRVRPEKYLYPRQRRKLFIHPYHIVQFAHFLKKEYEKEGVKDPQVYANLRIKLNGRKYRNYVIEGTDLTKVECSLFKSIDWLEDWDWDLE